MGPSRVRAGERGIVASDLRASPFGVVQKIEIVNRDHLRGARRGEEQRMKSMCNVETPAGEPLGARPPEPMPREIERANGNLPVDDRCARYDIRGKAVFPRGREKKEFLVGTGGGGDQRAGQLVGVFTD